ncbi:MAG TPA: type III secretion system export apparatus subunit SctV [Terriglobales bacterium]|jgi:type III secretion protein V|nr:type III secretion system export apparatus subunit SctV [Terriglobales bacterium]HMC73819.1 type III secretion system export apparatus subunit SctV [Terriglobales bacterium]
MIAKLQAQALGIKQEILKGNLTGVLTRFADLILVSLVGVMVGLMIVPLPTFLLDIFLTINITVAVTILMVSIYISSPTQIASYPTLLLITTLYRLSLDISATRLILLKADAGEVIRAFGMFVVSGNFVVGAVIFLIITLVQFIVITKGAERVAEVAARFTLDAMPGKQMSIDADLRAGIIDFHQARARREGLSRESQFYGAMDGAMKFVKGDAIAGIVITVINIVGGLIIGVAMNGMSAMEAVQTYSILTIGNGLVSQIPALLISISAGMVVTRVASETKDSNLGKDVASQILGQPKAIAVASGLLTVMAIIPGLPKIPFFILAALTGSLAWGLFRAQNMQAAAVEQTNSAAAGQAQDPQVSITVPLVLQVSEALTPLLDTATDTGKQFYEQLVQVRNGLYYDLGVIFPAIQVKGNTPGEAGSYTIWANEVPVVSGQIRLDAALVNDTAENLAIYGFKAEDTSNPATGKAAAWVPRADAERAKAVGLQVWDTHEILLLHVTHYLKRNARDFIGIQEVQGMVAALKQYYPTLVEETIPKPISLQTLTEILRRLVEEEVSIRDLKIILQTLCEWGRVEHEVLALTEQVRAGLKRKICYQISHGRPLLFVYRLDPEFEDMFRNSIRQSASGAYLSMDPASSQQLMAAARAQIGDLPPGAQRPVIVTDAEIRRFVKRLLDFAIPEITVLSYDQLTPQINLQPLGTISPTAQSQIAGQ